MCFRRFILVKPTVQEHVNKRLCQMIYSRLSPRHSREGGNPVVCKSTSWSHGIPAFAGMTLTCSDDRATMQSGRKV